MEVFTIAIISSNIQWWKSLQLFLDISKINRILDDWHRKHTLILLSEICVELSSWNNGTVRPVSTTFRMELGFICEELDGLVIILNFFSCSNEAGTVYSMNSNLHFPLMSIALNSCPLVGIFWHTKATLVRKYVQFSKK